MNFILDIGGGFIYYVDILHSQEYSIFEESLSIEEEDKNMILTNFQLARTLYSFQNVSNVLCLFYVLRSVVSFASRSSQKRISQLWTVSYRSYYTAYYIL